MNRRLITEISKALILQQLSLGRGFMKILAFILSAIMALFAFQNCGQFASNVSESLSSFNNPDNQVEIDINNSSYNIPAACQSYSVDQSSPTAKRLTSFEYFANLSAIFGQEIDQDIRDLFPEDVRSSGFLNQESALSVSRNHVAAFRDISVSIISNIDNIENLVSQRFGACTEDNLQCFTDMVNKMGERFFRRPLTDEERGRVLTLHELLTNTNFEEKASSLLSFFMQSPQFLYRLETQTAPGIEPIDQFELANRLSFLVWQTGPDQELLELAKAGGLNSEEVLIQQVDRMLEAPAARQALRNYVYNWLHFDLIGQIDITPNKYPILNFQLIEDMKEQTLRHFEELVFTENRSLMEAFTDQSTYLNSRLGQLYGINVVGDFQKVDVSRLPGRNGILSHPSVLMASLKSDHPSIVQRGVFINEHIACQVITPPPPDVADNNIIPEEGLSQRAILANNRNNQACAGCHSVLDAPGLAFDNFNTIGSFRSLDEQGNELMSFGSWQTADGMIEFNNTKHFADEISNMNSAQFCMASKVFQFQLGRVPNQVDQCEVWSFMDRFRESNYKYRDLIIFIATTRSFRLSGGEEN
jgi:hypothetical protein